MKPVLFRCCCGSLVFLVLTVGACGSTGPNGEGSPVRSPDADLRSRAQSVFRLSAGLRPLVSDPTNSVGDDLAAARLGQTLFFLPGLAGHPQVAQGEALASGESALSCASCHDPQRAFTDGRAVSLGAGIGNRNAPTILDAARERWLFRDGRADSLWAQALQPLEDSLEMAGTRTAVVQTLLRDPGLRAAFEDVFGAEARAVLARLEGAGLPEHARPPARGGLAGAAPALEYRAWGVWEALAPDTRQAIDQVFVQVGKALAAYERRLLTGPSPFDEWLAGRDAALSAEAEAGLELFVGEAGCLRCHFGPRLTDGEFHNLGVPTPNGRAPSDPGRFDGAARLAADRFSATGAFSDAPEGQRALQTRTLRVSGEDWGAFKTPSLRNVSQTAPYMHAGQFASLRDVLQFYSTLEGAMSGGHHAESTLQPANFTPREIEQLLAFLEALTGVDPPAGWVDAER